MPLDLDDNDRPLNSSDNGALDGDENLHLDNGADVDGADGAESSDAHGDNTERSTPDIVRDVVEAGRAGAASPAEGSEDGKKPEEQEPKKADDEEYSDVPFNKHPRFQHLLRAKKANEEDAGRYRNVQKFMDDSNLTAEETADGFIVMAALKNDPHKAWELLKPVVQSLLIATGEVLPPELQAKVDAGEYTAEAAAELARANAKLKTVEQRGSFEQQRRAQQTEQAQKQALYDTATGWVSDRKAKDPSFAAKEPLLRKEVAYLIQTEGKPDTPEGVRDQLERAYKEVVVPTAPRARVAPKVGAGTQARPSANDSATGSNIQPRPKNTLDIISQVVSQRG